MAGVSTATVSATINQSAYVSPELRRRVEEAVQQLGYAPDGVARSLKRGRTHLIGLIVADITNPYFTELVHVIEQVAQKAGYSVLLCDADETFAREADYLRLMRTHRVDGVILSPTGRVADYQNPLYRDPSLPLVVVDRVNPNLHTDAVLVDNFTAAVDATRHLLDLGHRRIATITGPMHLLGASERLRGFRSALEDRGLPLDDNFIRLGNYREADSFDQSMDLFAGADRPTAVFVANNHMLVGVMRALAQLGLACPRDVSVVGIDDFAWANAFTPKLTTVRQPVRDIGETAVRMLLARLNGTAPPEPVRETFSSTLMVRESCAPLEPAKAG